MPIIVKRSVRQQNFSARFWRFWIQAMNSKIIYFLLPDQELYFTFVTLNKKVLISHFFRIALAAMIRVFPAHYVEGKCCMLQHAIKIEQAFCSNDEFRTTMTKVRVQHSCKNCYCCYCYYHRFIRTACGGPPPCRLSRATRLGCWSFSRAL